MDQTTIEILKLAVTTIATGVAAAFGISIARSQRDIARRQAVTASESREIAAAKLNLDLFDKRFELFSDVWKYLSLAANVSHESPLTTNFSNLIPRARFLFGDDIAGFMDEAFRRRAALVLAHKAYGSQYNVEHAKQISDQTTWLLDAASNCHKKFAPYMDFSRWQARHWATDFAPTSPDGR